MTQSRLVRLLLVSSAFGISVWAMAAASSAVYGLAGTSAVLDRTNLYGRVAAAGFSPAVEGALPRVYVPTRRSDAVYVIDPETRQVVDRFAVGKGPQHIVPSGDLKTLWVANTGSNRTDGSVTPIDPKTGKPGPPLRVDDPYNLYFTPDGKSAIVVAERYSRLDFRDPVEMALEQSLPTPQCAGINHADFSLDGSYAIFTCEFRGGGLIKLDIVGRQVVGYLKLARTALVGENSSTADPQEIAATVCGPGMPQDIRISPDGSIFYVADMMADGVFLVDGESFKQVGFIPTGVGTHGLYPSRDGTKLYVVNRGSHNISGQPHGRGSISVIDFASKSIVTTWPIPGGGSPDMGNVSADGKVLWLSARYDDVVYAIDTSTGAVITIPVGKEPHGLTVWPQPGRYSLGHTGNMR